MVKGLTRRQAPPSWRRILEIVSDHRTAPFMRDGDGRAEGEIERDDRRRKISEMLRRRAYLYGAQQARARATATTNVAE
jgi:hypothetical protein